MFNIDFIKKFLVVLAFFGLAYIIVVKYIIGFFISLF